MIKTDCNICDTKDISLNETIKIDGKTYCNNCFQAEFSDQTELKNKLVEKEYDATICSFCSKDFDNISLNKLGKHPICSNCEISIKNKTFPTWVKLFLVGILVIIVGSFIWNWKYYSAYNNIQEAFNSFTSGDYKNASLLMDSASEKVPEVEDFKTLSAYFKGTDLLLKDKNEQALVEFNKCKDKLSSDYKLDELIIKSRIGITFDHKDYEGFLKASKENLAIDSTQAVSLTSVASAYACIYAAKGDEKAKLRAFDYLQRAKKIDSASKDMKEYYNMIEYRIDSRKIIKREDFVKQFPKGWTKN